MSKSADNQTAALISLSNSTPKKALIERPADRGSQADRNQLFMNATEQIVRFYEISCGFTVLSPVTHLSDDNAS